MLCRSWRGCRACCLRRSLWVQSHWSPLSVSIASPFALDREAPAESRLQAAAGRAVPGGVAALRPGDLLLFSGKGRGVDHVAIYVGDNRMIHSSAGAGGVIYDDLSTPRGRWYLARHVTSRRVL